jgi:hypothetical protein
MYTRILTGLTFALVISTMAATTNGVTFNLRQENGVDQYYRLEVPPNLPPAKPDTVKISQNEVPIIAVGWAAGLETTGGLTNLGAGKPGGFYNASYVKVDSVQYQTSPVPYYLVQMKRQDRPNSSDILWFLCSFRLKLIGLPKCSRPGSRAIALRYACSRSKPA